MHPVEGRSALVHLGAGIGNVVFGTPLLVALNELGLKIDVQLSADYVQTRDLFAGWSVIGCIRDRVSRAERQTYDYVLPALPPFYWARFRHEYKDSRNCVARPAESSFYEDEQDFYLRFARTLGYTGPAPYYALPISPGCGDLGITERTVVLAPGCKTGEMAAKRWPYFAELAERFSDVAIVGTQDDLFTPGRQGLVFPEHTRSFVGKLSLRQTAELMASAGLVVANDSGLAHVAGASGVSTVILFGPTPDRTLGHLPPNVTVLRAGLDCEPCWFVSRFAACGGSIRCLAELPAHRVEISVRSNFIRGN